MVRDLWRLAADLVHTKGTLSHQGSERPGFAPPRDLIPGTTSEQTPSGTAAVSAADRECTKA